MNYRHLRIDDAAIDLPMGKVVCVGRNYAEHAKELNNPVPEQPLLFIKPGSCVVPFAEDGFCIPPGRGAVHYEAEIAVLLGAPLSGKVSSAEVMQAILTLRDVQNRLKEQRHPWELAKAFDGAYVLSPFIAADNVEDTNNIDIRLSINGVVRQQGNSGEMCFPIVRLIAFIAEHFSLEAGDVVSSGTPAGVGELHSGDTLELSLPAQAQWFASRVKGFSA